MNVRHFRNKNGDFHSDWFSQVQDKWDYEDFQNREPWRSDWISFDCLLFLESTGVLYTGVSSFVADIFWAFDTKTNEFHGTGFDRVADRFDAKFHRSLVYNEHDGCMYAAIALFHDVDNFLAAPGGAIVRYNPRTGEIAKIATPFPHVYIQSLIIDQERQMLYGQTFTPEYLFSYSIRTGEFRDLGLIGSGMRMAQAENLELDDRGAVWGTWGITRAWQPESGPDSSRLFRFDPETGRLEFLKHGLARPDGQPGFVKPEGFFNFGTGALYASGGNGSLYRIDTASGRSEYLGTPIPDRPSRLASMVIGRDGAAYGVTGKLGKTELLRFDPHSEHWRLVGPVRDANGIGPYQIHHIVRGKDDVLYAAENDNPYRSSYLWEIDLAISR